ncbi:SDR family oxidoreductase [Kordiimonas sp. SCSIO 12603]|uniref:SDR family NAD(P)-dependent oxidoreductase n=1 Tax=Kordiimonas sp. SCSIO 12603 TaxID=2829596 RepID=UPI00210310EC|nr:SDR family oxidoreductase [Kordiimonas sp. SCSIO 12603]UTW57799.1 SDR family oxidoreductase [Kordiimonas sp. SCSIO 12603]
MSNDFLTNIFSLEGQVALVAGASSGIGAEFASALAKAGANVVLGARRTDRIQKLADDIAAETGRKTLAVALDVTSGDSVRAAFDAAEEAIGTVTIICNNAGIGRPKYALDDTEEDWDITMETNLKGMWRVGTEAARRMQAAGKGGSIINTASVLGLMVGPQQLTYATSKAGVIQMTKVMALEWQRFGIRVNALCPGYFKTEINDKFLESDLGQRMLKATPAKRHGELAELVPSMLMFASPASSFTTGVALPVDGAHTLRIA